MSRRLRPTLLFLTLLVGSALPVEAQGPRSSVSSGGTTRGSTRAVESRREARGGGGRGDRSGSRSDGRSGSSDDARADRVSRSTGPRWSRRRRIRVALVPGAVLEHPCDRVVRGYCIYDRWDYVGDSMFGFGFSFGLVGSLLATSNNPVSNARLPGSGLDAGLLPMAGADVRAFTVFDRLRLGGVFQGGGAAVPGAVPLEGAFEEGSEITGGFHVGIWAMLAYAPQVTDFMQLWIGGRVGWHLLELEVRWQGRLYDRMQRSFLSAGPELGVRFDDGGSAGVMLWVFADLAQPGHVQATVAFHFEEPRPPTPTW